MTVRNDPAWIPSFQDFSNVVAYAHVQYSSDRTSVIFYFLTSGHGRNRCNDPRSDRTIKVFFWWTSFQLKHSTIYELPTKVSSLQLNYKSPLSIDVYGSDGSHISLDPVDFVWNAPAIAPRNGDYRSGQKGTVTTLSHPYRRYCGNVWLASF
jgi:alpha-amylase